jgi:glycerol dehydrogenase
VTRSLENIVEANILLSGLGFESAGLAAAHAIHNGLSALEPTHNYYHGEKVAFGTLVQLILENANPDELSAVLDFCHTVGLPICLEDIGITQITDKELIAVAEKACIPEESIHFMPFPITPADVVDAIKVADVVGSCFKTQKALRF